MREKGTYVPEMQVVENLKDEQRWQADQIEYEKES